jgi:micrococcal nuclease
MKKRKTSKKYLIVVVLLSIMVFSGHFVANYNNVGKSIEDNNENSFYDYKDRYTDPNTSNINYDNISGDYDAKGFCNYVIDGDTLDVEGVGRIRFVGVDTPERGQSGYSEAKDYVKSKCLGKTIYLDIDDKKNYDKYGRVLAVVYVDGININQELLKLNYAKILYIPPSEFDPYNWIN